jgi:3-hydroxyacyl-CoA dehydrogenase/enoyl-CoA hydratase/3-hydroxybutyryl-CoA epimerase
MVQPKPVDFGVFQVYMDGKMFAWLVMDRPGKSVNAIGNDFDESITKATEFLQEQYAKGTYKVVVLTSGKKSFCVGADVTEVFPVTNKEEIRTRLANGRKAMKRIADLKAPTVAAINGEALGGGLEIALACDYRIASSKAKLGLPEVMLGVIPGLGGTVRMPKLVGIQNALQFILQAKQLKADKAKKAGLIDAVVDDNDRFKQENRFFMEARTFAGKMSLLGKKKKDKPKSWQEWFLSETPIGRKIVTDQTLKTLNKATGGKYPAPYKAFESIMNAVIEKNIDKAIEFESECFAEMCVSPQSKSLMSLFFLQDRCKRLEAQSAHFSPKDVIPVKEFGLLGAGVMGSGIAHWAAKSKLKVYMKDINDAAVKKGLAFVQGEFEKDLKKKKLTNDGFKEAVGRVKGGITNDGLKSCKVIIEGAVEVMSIKKKIVEELENEGIFTKDVIFATNTSALSVNELAAASKFPEMVVGMHFFNPVARMLLVEVVKGVKSSPKAVATVYKMALDMGKFPIVCTDGPGFLVNRCLGIYMGEAGRMLDEGCDPEKVDKQIVEFGMPMGPFRLLDEVGVDVAAHVGPTLKTALGDRFTDSPKLNILVKQNLLGKKTGKGFYQYNEKGKETKLDMSNLQTLNVVSVKSDFKYQDVVDRCVLCMVNEAALILDEKIVAAPEDVDLGMVFGTGFAPFRGGLLAYADNRGAGPIVDALNNLAAKYGDRFKPCNKLIQMAANKERFFPDRPLVPMKEGKVPTPKVKLM